MKIALIASLVFLVWALFDPNFNKEATKPDNIPIWLMSYGVAFFFWLSISRGAKNDELMAAGEPNLEKAESDKKVYTWPDLVYSELICIVAFTAFMVLWGIVFDAPLEDPANSGVTPAVAKAPWYFLGLQELLVYYDPWIAGVVLPGFIVVGLIAIPYMDTNPKGNGYYTVKDRFDEIWLFGFGFVVLWIALIFLGTFMRGPGWNFFGPFEYWDTHKVVPMNNVNVSEIFWIKILGVGLPSNILLREIVGLVLVSFYMGALPKLLLKIAKFKAIYEKMGFVRYYIFIVMFLVMASLPIKMYLRWGFDLKYIISIPEFMFNI
ncbi:cytochrome C [bacterium]|nr:cytochrome C [bacterium]